MSEEVVCDNATDDVVPNVAPIEELAGSENERFYDFSDPYEAKTAGNEEFKSSRFTEAVNYYTQYVVCKVFVMMMIQQSMGVGTGVGTACQ